MHLAYMQCSIVDTARYCLVTLIMTDLFNEALSLPKIVIDKSINALTYCASHYLIHRACYEIYRYTGTDATTLCDASLYVFSITILHLKIVQFNRRCANRYQYT